MAIAKANRETSRKPLVEMLEFEGKKAALSLFEAYELTRATGDWSPEKLDPNEVDPKYEALLKVALIAETIASLDPVPADNATLRYVSVAQELILQASNSESSLYCYRNTPFIPRNPEERIGLYWDMRNRVQWEGRRGNEMPDPTKVILGHFSIRHEVEVS